MLFGRQAVVMNVSSLALHVLNTWLVFALGSWRLIGWRTAAVTAAFFAVYEGHQEAVIWYAALPELLVFTFVLLSVLSWLRWLQAPGNGNIYYAAAVLFYVLALASKESGVVTAPLLAAVSLAAGVSPRRAAAASSPFWILGGLYFLWILASKSDHLFFNDGTFSPTAPFWLTVGISTARLFWFWGAAALAAIAAAWSRERNVRLLVFAAAWIGVTLLPYSFLTYMPRVPSRHTYLASLGLSLVVASGAAAAWRLFEARRRWLIPALAGLVILHNCGYIWTRKHAQFAERAAPTEEVLKAMRETAGKIHVRCFPYGPEVAEYAVSIHGGDPSRLVFQTDGCGSQDRLSADAKQSGL